MKNNFIIWCYTKFLASSRGFLHCRGKCLKQLRRHLRIGTVSTVCRTLLMGLYFPSLGKHHCLQVEVVKECELIVIEVTGLWVRSLVSVLKKTCHPSVYPTSSPNYKQRVLCTVCQEGVLGEVASVVHLCLVPEQGSGGCL